MLDSDTERICSLVNGFNGFWVYETHLQEPNEDHECLKDEAEAGKGSDFLRDIGSIALYQILKGSLWGMPKSTGQNCLEPYTDFLRN